MQPPQAQDAQQQAVRLRATALPSLHVLVSQEREQEGQPQCSCADEMRSVRFRAGSPPPLSTGRPFSWVCWGRARGSQEVLRAGARTSLGSGSWGCFHSDPPPSLGHSVGTEPCFPPVFVESPHRRRRHLQVNPFGGSCFRILHPFIGSSSQVTPLCSFLSVVATQAVAGPGWIWRTPALPVPSGVRRAWFVTRLACGHLLAAKPPTARLKYVCLASPCVSLCAGVWVSGGSRSGATPNSVRSEPFRPSRPGECRA